MAAIDLVSLQEAKDHLEITGTAKDAVLPGLISGASLQLEQWCKTQLVQRAVVERQTAFQHDGRGSMLTSEGFGQGTRFMYLRLYPIVTMTSIVDESSTPQSMVENVDYYARKRLGVLEHFSIWPMPYKGDLVGEWIVTYTAGWFASTATVDANVKLACNMLVAEHLARKAAALMSMSTGTVTMQFSDPGDAGLPAVVRALMAKYRTNRI